MKVRTRYELAVETDFLDGVFPSVDYLMQAIKEQLLAIEVVLPNGETEKLIIAVDVDHIEPRGLLGG